MIMFLYLDSKYWQTNWYYTSFFRKFHAVLEMQFGNATFHWAKSCRTCFIQIVRLVFGIVILIKETAFTWTRGFIAGVTSKHGDAYSSEAPDPTSGISIVLFLPNFSMEAMKFITVRYLGYFCLLGSTSFYVSIFPHYMVVRMIYLPLDKMMSNVFRILI
jgi:hypothetical protein